VYENTPKNYATLPQPLLAWKKIYARCPSALEAIDFGIGQGAGTHQFLLMLDGRESL